MEGISSSRQHLLGMCAVKAIVKRDYMRSQFDCMLCPSLSISKVSNHECTPARNGCRGMRRAAQLVQTRCGVPSWNLGGSSMRAALQGAQKMLPHRRQWCRVRRRDLQQSIISLPSQHSSNNPAAASERRCRTLRECSCTADSPSCICCRTCMGSGLPTGQIVGGKHQ